MATRASAKLLLGSCPHSAVVSTQPTDPTAVQNRQDQKQAFVANGGDTATHNPANLQLPASPYHVMAGTIISAAAVRGQRFHQFVVSALRRSVQMRLVQESAIL